MPAAEEPTGVIELAGNDEEGWLQCIVPLPGGDRVVTASSKGKVRVFAVTTGALEHELDAHKGAIGERALAALGGDIIISGGKNDGTIVTWNTASGDWLGEAAVGDGVIALAALDDWQFVAGTDCGDVMFYKHDRGRGVEEAACVVDEHSDGISDFALCGGRLATASSDQTATVWSVDSRERVATLSGHTDWVVSVDMNDQLVVTASNDKTVRVYNAERGYSCTAVVGWFHTDWVNSVAIIGDDHILSASHDHNVCVTQISTGLIVARKDLRTPVHCAAAL
jgi:WD40 repeat protein